MEKINEKIKDHPNAAEISNHVNKIIQYIDYEVDKFRDHRSSVIFTGNLHPSSLFTMASHTKYYDLTQGINNVSIELEKIYTKYGLKFDDNICSIFYERFSEIAIIFLDGVDSLYSERVKHLLSSRNKSGDGQLFQEMHKLIMELDTIDNPEVKKMIEIIVRVDPLYKSLNQQHSASDLHNINIKELNFDFVDYAVKFFNKIYKQAFGDEDDEDDDANRPKL